MKRILFVIHDLAGGGAEKVLVNLVNNMDRNKFDITVISLFGGGVNEQFLNESIKLKSCFPKAFKGNSQVLKLFKPETLYRHFIKEKYDIIVSYLEGPAARIVSGCDDKSTKLVSWIHVQQDNVKTASYSFRSYQEAKDCYDRFDRIICVSEYVKQDFINIFHYQKPVDVLYNTNETKQIMELAEEQVEVSPAINICVVGKLGIRKGVDRIARIQKRLLDEGYNTHIWFIGEGAEERNLKAYFQNNKIADTVIFTGYTTNPFKYIKRCDLFVCASLAEGFSTAATEALVLGVPVCTVEVSGMKEMLGENNEYGIVTENSEEALYDGIKSLLDNPELLAFYKEKAAERGKMFSTETTVQAVESMLMSL